MAEEDNATIGAQLLGTGDEARWVVGEYDTNPVHVHLAPELIEALADGGRIGAEHLPRLAAVTTRKIERGEGRFGRREPDGRGMLVLNVRAADWDERF